MKVFLPNIIVPPGIEMHVDVPFDGDACDFFVNGVELAESALVVMNLDVIDPKGISIALFPYAKDNKSYLGTFLTKGSRVSLKVKNPTDSDIRIDGFLKGHAISSVLPFDLETKAKLLRMFDECIITARNIQYHIKQSFMGGTR